MKNLNLFALIIILLIIHSCSNEPLETNEFNRENPEITNYIFKRFNTTTTPNTVILSTNFIIENNRIVSSSGLNSQSGVQSSSNYIYLNDRISEIQSLTDGNLTRIQSFNYDTDGNLIEYLSESIDVSTQESFFNRHLFTHTTTNDTILSTWDRSTDGINYDIQIANSRIVLENDNRTYFENFDLINDTSTFITSIYDNNDNLLSDSSINNNHSTISDGVGTGTLITNNYRVNSNVNLFYRINEATFTRRLLMLLYHLQSNALNNFNVKIINPNTLDVFQSSFTDNTDLSFDISNTVNDNNLTIISDFRTLNNDETFSRFTQEFIISNNP